MLAGRHTPKSPHQNPGRIERLIVLADKAFAACYRNDTLGQACWSSFQVGAADGLEVWRLQIHDKQPPTTAPTLDTHSRTEEVEQSAISWTPRLLQAPPGQPGR